MMHATAAFEVYKNLFDNAFKARLGAPSFVSSLFLFSSPRLLHPSSTKRWAPQCSIIYLSTSGNTLHSCHRRISKPWADPNTLAWASLYLSSAACRSTTSVAYLYAAQKRGTAFFASSSRAEELEGFLRHKLCNHGYPLVTTRLCACIAIATKERRGQRSLALGPLGRCLHLCLKAFSMPAPTPLQNTPAQHEPKQLHAAQVPKVSANATDPSIA